MTLSIVERAMRPGTGRRVTTLLIVTGAAVLAIATSGMLAGVEPFATWYYLFAWYATLLVVDAAVARRGGHFFFLDRPTFLVSLLAWSVPFWLLFELVNFRVQNWYYVFVPDGTFARWVGIGLSYATVLPAILGAERLLDVHGIARGARIAPLRLTPRLLVVIQAVGVAGALLALVWPRFFFPLVWGSFTLIVDPWVYRRAPERSLLGDLERGRPGRILRLLLGGLAIGFVWELYNLEARGKWIYTVPGLEDLKLFEMPLLGFLGFPVFALDGFAAWQALVLAGAAVPESGRVRPAPAIARAAVVGAAIVFSALVLRGMERATVSSMTPRLAAITGIPTEALESAGWDAYRLARASPGPVADAAGATSEAARGWIATARLAVLSGIGTVNAERLRLAGVATVADLAAAHPADLARRLERGGDPVPPARVRVWVDAAGDAIASTP
ncbi:MAG: DUF4332 domain-containing protein [Gemmatimonadota bacterium]